MSKKQSTDAGITSSTFSNPLFMTPLAELSFDKVSPDEQQQYERFRAVYQRQWQNILGPAAVCFLHESGQTYIDLTLRSAVCETEYGKYLPSSHATLRPQQLPPCSLSIAQVVTTVDSQSPFLAEMNRLLSQSAPSTPPNVFGWLGGWMTVYA